MKEQFLIETALSVCCRNKLTRGAQTNHEFTNPKRGAEHDKEIQQRKQEPKLPSCRA